MLARSVAVAPSSAVAAGNENDDRQPGGPESDEDKADDYPGQRKATALLRSARSLDLPPGDEPEDEPQ